MYRIKCFSLVFAFVLALPCFSQADSVSEKGKNWKVKLNTSWVHEDNLIGTPTNGTARPAGIVGTSPDADGFNWDLTADYKYKFNDKINFKLNYDLDQTYYGNNSAYDVTTQFFGVGMTRKINPLTNFQLDYKYIYNIVDRDDFSGIHYVNPAFNHMHAKYGLTRIDYLYKYTDNWKFDSRDTTQNSIGLTQYVFFSNFKRRVSLGYRFAKDDATGFLAFSRKIHDFKFSIKSPIAYGVNLNAKTKFSIRDYTNRPTEVGGVAGRNDYVQNYSIKLDKSLLKHWKCLNDLVAEASYRHNFNNSNELVRNHKNNIFKLGLTAKF